MEYLWEERVQLVYDLPLAEIVLDYYDQLKSRTRGYASFDYDLLGFREGNLVKVDVLLAGEQVDSLSLITHRDNAYKQGKQLVEALRERIPRQMFEVAIQAAIGSRVIARETVKAKRKDVLAKCYGGDVTRKRKLLEKQKKGKKRMEQVGNIEVPQEAFLAVLNINREEVVAGGSGWRWLSTSTCTCRSARIAAATATSSPSPATRAARPLRRRPDRRAGPRHPGTGAGDDLRRRGHAVAAGAAAACTAAVGTAGLPGAHRRMQPRDGSDAGRAQVLVEGGVTRVSLGAQSFRPRLLATLERLARRSRSARRRSGCWAGGDFKPQPRLDVWGSGRDDLRSAPTSTMPALQPDHVSYYELEAKPGTRFTHAHGDELERQAEPMEDHYETVVAPRALATGGMRPRLRPPGPRGAAQSGVLGRRRLPWRGSGRGLDAWPRAVAESAGADADPRARGRRRASVRGRAVDGGGAGRRAADARTAA